MHLTMNFVVQRVALLISYLSDENYMKQETKPEMLYSYLGNTGLKVSRLGFGAWVTFGIQVNESLAYDLMKVYIDVVYRIDCI